MCDQPNRKAFVSVSLHWFLLVSLMKEAVGVLVGLFWCHILALPQQRSKA